MSVAAEYQDDLRVVDTTASNLAESSKVTSVLLFLGFILLLLTTPVFWFLSCFSRKKPKRVFQAGIDYVEDPFAIDPVDRFSYPARDEVVKELMKGEINDVTCVYYDIAAIRQKQLKDTGLR
jgi:hypothetical protein